MNATPFTVPDNPAQAATPAPTAGGAKPKLLDQMRRELRVRHYAYRTELTYLDWVKDYIFYHGKTHPAQMGVAEINRYLSHLASDRNVTASTQNQALCGILFLYRYVLKIDIGDLGDIIRATKAPRLPVVMTIEETRKVLDRLPGVYRLIGDLMYGTGMRVMEVVRLRVKDVDFDRHLITRGDSSAVAGEVRGCQAGNLIPRGRFGAPDRQTRRRRSRPPVPWLRTIRVLDAFDAFPKPWLYPLRSQECERGGDRHATPPGCAAVGIDTTLLRLEFIQADGEVA